MCNSFCAKASVCKKVLCVWKIIGRIGCKLRLSLPLSIYVSLWLQVTCHMMPFTKQHSACAWVVTCILFLINLTFHNLSLHSSYTIHQPFTDYFLRLPYSEQLEKRPEAQRFGFNGTLWLMAGRATRQALFLSEPVLRRFDRIGSVGGSCLWMIWFLVGAKLGAYRLLLEPLKVSFCHFVIVCC